MILRIQLRNLLAMAAALPFAQIVQGAPCLLPAEQETGPFYIPQAAMRRYCR